MSEMKVLGEEERPHFLAAESGIMLNPRGWYYRWGKDTHRTAENAEVQEKLHQIRHSHEKIAGEDGKPQWRQPPRLVISGRKTLKVSFCPSRLVTTTRAYFDKSTGKEIPLNKYGTPDWENCSSHNFEYKDVEVPEENWINESQCSNWCRQTFNEFYGPLKILV